MSEERDITINVKAKNETAGGLGGVREELEKLKRVAGGRGSIKEIAETLGGAGAIAGLVEVAEKLGEGFKAASEAIRSINNELATADQRSLAWDQTLEKIPLVGTGARLGEGIVDLVGAIGQATGASEEFVERWTTAGTKIAEAKAALDALANTKAFFSDGGKTAELAARSNAAGESGLELAHRQQEQRHQQDLAKARELRQRADNDFEMAPDKRQALREQADRLEQFANQVNAKELRKIDADNADAYVKVQLDAQDKIDAAHAAARQADLKLNGAVLKAELEQIDTETQATLSQLERSLADNQKRMPEHAKELEAKFIDERDAFNDAARKRKFTAEIDNENRIAQIRSADIESITRKTKLDGLKLEASIGNRRSRSRPSRRRSRISTRTSARRSTRSCARITPWASSSASSSSRPGAPGQAGGEGQAHRGGKSFDDRLGQDAGRRRHRRRRDFNRVVLQEVDAQPVGGPTAWRRRAPPNLFGPGAPGGRRERSAKAAAEEAKKQTPIQQQMLDALKVLVLAAQQNPGSIFNPR
jgi:hypothetical protein